VLTPAAYAASLTVNASFGEPAMLLVLSILVLMMFAACDGLSAVQLLQGLLGAGLSSVGRAHAEFCRLSPRQIFPGRYSGGAGILLALGEICLAPAAIRP
jgi:hypothetical protein